MSSANFLYNHFPVQHVYRESEEPGKVKHNSEPARSNNKNFRPRPVEERTSKSNGSSTMTMNVGDDAAAHVAIEWSCATK